MLDTPREGEHHQIRRWLSTLPVAIKETATFHAGFIITPLGSMLAISDEHHLHMLEFCDLDTLENRLKKLHHLTRFKIEFGRSDIIKQLEIELAAYFAGDCAAFSVSCFLHGSDFSQQAWRFLQKIPVANTCSYAEQAVAIGYPTAYRAVARANSQNWIAIIIPCHRVIGTNGKLTGYAGGLKRKQWLLDHEKRYFT